MARKTWWPGTLPEQLALVMNVLAKITGHQAALGLTNAQRVKIEELCNSYIAVYNYVELSRETAGSLIEWRQDCFYRPGGGAQDAPPGFSAFAPPAGAVAGCVDEFKEQRDMIVSGGLGCSALPIRFGALPEIVVVDLGGGGVA